MNTRLKAALILALLLFAGWFAGDRVSVFGMRDYYHCSDRLTRYDAPPADVLFVGNSRMGRAVDSDYVQQRISNVLSRNVSVERLSLTGPTANQFTIYLANYIRYRGFPGTVVFNVPYELRPNRMRSVDHTVHAARNLAFGHPYDLFHISRETVFNNHRGRLPYSMAAGVPNSLATLIHQISLKFYAGLKLPSNWFNGKMPDCSGDRLFEQTGFWFYKEVSDDVVFDLSSAPSEAKQDEWKSIIDTYTALRPLDEDRHYENRQLRMFLDLFKASDTRVFFTLIPAFSQTIRPEADYQALGELFPEADIIDFYQLFATPDAEDLKLSYRDKHHLDKYGAFLASRYYSDQLIDILNDRPN
jgi:hypothetical protein